MNFINKNKIKEIAKRVAEKNSVLLIEVIIRGNERNPVLEIFVDNQKGITTQLCAEISADLSEIIDEENLIKGDYRLDVSSPGIDRPLKFLQQFYKHKNRKFELKYYLNDKLLSDVGVLEKIENDKLVFKIKKSKLQLKFDEIKKAKVLASL